MRTIVMLALVFGLSSCAASPTKSAPTPAPSGITATVPALLAQPDTPAKLDPKHPLHIGEEYYPIESRKHREEGTCVVRLQVDSDGYIRAAQLLTSTGFQRLNDACLSSAIDGHMIPATMEGKPAASWFLLRVNWKLSGSGFNDIQRIRDDYQLKIAAEDYPPLSRKLHQEGDYVVHATAEKDGPPSKVTLTKSAGYAPLDEACIAAVQQAPFIAARLEPGIVSASTDINIAWRLPSP
jgi:TonB family protein